MAIVIPQPLDEESSTKKMPLGTRYVDERTGKVYYYVKAHEALTLGAILTPMIALFDGDCDASAGTAFVDAAATFTEVDTVDCFIKINVGTTSISQAPNRVLEFTDANNLVMETAWGTALTTAEDYVIYNPWFVEECDAAGERIVGVAPIAVTINYYFWMQSGGYCEAVKTIGGTDAIVGHEGLVSSTTAGTAKGLTAAATTVDEAEKANITAIVPSALTQLAPAYLNCLP